MPDTPRYEIIGRIRCGPIRNVSERLKPKFERATVSPHIFSWRFKTPRSTCLLPGTEAARCFEWPTRRTSPTASVCSSDQLYNTAHTMLPNWWDVTIAGPPPETHEMAEMHKYIRLVLTWRLFMRQPHHRSARVWHALLRDLTVLPAHPRISPRIEWTTPAFVFSVETSFTQRGGKLSWPKHHSGE